MSGEDQHDRPQQVYEDMLDGLPTDRHLQVAGQAPEEISLCLHGFSGLMRWPGRASLVGVLTDEQTREFGQPHLKFCQTIYPFKDGFYSTVKEGGEE